MLATSSTATSASTSSKENLDERIERMKKQNEEIEKKHREAEEDRLMALERNAMVKTKLVIKDSDWPKAHKFDNLDFDYDVKEKIELQSSQTKEESISTPGRREFKKFAEGEGPPPDPVYNFLADAERDGTNEKTQKDLTGSSNGKRSGPQFKKNPNDCEKTPKYEQWRSERNRIDDARVNRQKTNDNKWRREWDTDKSDKNNRSNGDASNGGSKKNSYNNEKMLSPTSSNNSLLNQSNNSQNITVSVSQTGNVKSVKLTSAPVIGTGRVGPRQVVKPQFQIQAFETEQQAHNINSNNTQYQQQQQLRRPHKNGSVSNNRDINTNVNGNLYSAIKEIPQHQLQQLQHQQQLQQQLHQQHQLQQQYPQQMEILITPKSPVKRNIVPLSTPVTVPSAPKNLDGKKSKSKNLIVQVPAKSDAIDEAALTPTPPPELEAVLKNISKKPEFARKSVQDRLLKIRQKTPSSEEVQMF